MPEYLAPGVYVEEVSFRSKSIEGVATTTTGFVGPTRYGPITEDLEVLTSLLDFERTYGDGQPLVFKVSDTDVITPNYLWHATRAFFENGGARLYVKRVYRQGGSSGEAHQALDAGLGSIGVKARFPGAAGARTVTLTLERGPNVLVVDGAIRRLVGVQERDVLVLLGTGSGSSGGSSTSSSALQLFTAARDSTGAWELRQPPQGDPPHEVPAVKLSALGATDQVRVLTLAVTDQPPSLEASSTVWSGLPLDPAHMRAGKQDSAFSLFTANPANRADAMRLPLVLDIGTGTDGVEVARMLLGAPRGIPGPLLAEALTRDSAPIDRSIMVTLGDGADGAPPAASDYEGGRTGSELPLGLVAFEDIEDIAIVAAPGSSRGYESDATVKASVATVQQALIAHCEQMRYRIAILDSGDNQTVAQVRQMRAALDSSHAAFYYPWVRIFDPFTQAELNLPPSGFVAGIYARNDIQRAVYKAPANEVVTLAIGFERTLNKGQQDVLNPEGVNCFRYFPGRGLRLWGARTASSDPEWKYVNLRRYFAYVEHSIDRGTQWAVFEPNGERLWANVRRTIEDFLFNEWQGGALLGDKPEMSFFVKCDRTTMTQADLDNGRLVCLIGLAPLRPAEYVIFRIGQWTADRRS
jgi:phage tail sheath protein FI